MKKYHAPQTEMWDGWFVNRGDETHVFHLKLPVQGCTLSKQEGWAVGHAVTKDGLHWEKLPCILPPLEDDNFPKDFHSKFTGCAVEKDNKCYLFYTMRDKEKTSQRFGVAISEDWVNFLPYEGNPILENDNDLLIGFESINKFDWNIVDCRDLIVVDDHKGGYYGYYAAAADIGMQSPVGVVVMVKSDDLINWCEPKIVYNVDHNGIVEVPDLFYMDGKWVLVCLTGQNYSGRAVTNDDYLNNVTIYAVSDKPEGPFIETDDNIFIGGPQTSGFTCRTIVREGKRYLYYVDRSFGGNTLSLPKEVAFNKDGNVRVIYSKLLEKLRVSEIDTADKLSLAQNSFAWRTFGGKISYDNGRYALSTNPKDYQPVAMDINKDSIEISMTISVDAVGGGIYIEAERNFALFVEPSADRIILTRLYDFDYIAARRFPFALCKEYELRCILMDGTIEAYINGDLLLQCGLECKHIRRTGLICDRGNINVTNYKVYELE